MSAISLESLLPTACRACESSPRIRRVLTSRFIAGRILRAQEEERARIARELHDETGQTLTLLLVRLHVLGALVEDARASKEIEELRGVVGEAIASVRRLASDLGPTALRELGLEAALGSLVARVRQDGEIDVFLRTDVEGLALPSSVALALYRVAQESLTNVLRHARATRVDVRLERLGGGVRLLVQDDGVGFTVPDDVDASTIGVFGMRERVELVGGAFDIQSRPGRGARVSAVVPAALE